MNRHLGQIKWFGGYDRQRNRENEFGFIVQHGRDDIYIHVKDVISDVTYLQKDAWVTYEIYEEKGGRVRAKKLLLLSEEESSIIIEILSQFNDADLTKICRVLPASILCIQESSFIRNKLDIESRFIIYSELDVLPDYIAEEIVEISRKLEDIFSLDYQRYLFFWRKWESKITPEEKIYLAAPEKIKKDVCKKYFKELINAVNGLDSPACKIEFNFLSSLINEEDKNLAARWQSKNNEFEKTKMLSARFAEKAAKLFYEKFGFSVVDTSIKQIRHDGDDWRTHDLFVINHGPVDVKNSRTPVSSRNFYVEHIVKQFKKCATGENVKITGVLSPYLKLEHMNGEEHPYFNVEPVRILGEVCNHEIISLEKEFSTDYLKLEIRRTADQVIPSWIFEYPLFFYEDKKSHIDLIKNHKSISDEHWPYLDIYPIPAMLRSQSILPSYWKNKLDHWQVELYAQILSRCQISGITRPRIFLSLLLHFLYMLRKDEAPNSYSPIRYHELIYRKTEKNSDYRELKEIKMNPVGLLDPLGIIDALCQNLEVIWKNRSDLQLDRFSSFKLSGLGLLQSRGPSDNYWTTLIAWCGGRIEGKGSCGKYPLVIGIQQTCQECGKLICDKCNFCSQGCVGISRRESKENEEYPTDNTQDQYALEQEYHDYLKYLNFQQDKFYEP